jgi:hypothetical protein
MRPVLAIAAAAAVLAAPAIARACTPCYGERYAQLADAREHQPGNTGVVLYNIDDLSQDVVVSIDGAPAGLELDETSPAVSGPGGGFLPVAHVVPIPPVGSIVELSSTMPTLCFGQMLHPETFTAGLLDETVPDPIVDPWWDLLTLDVAAPQCSDPAAVIWVRGDLVAEPETESIRIIEVQLRLDGQTLFIRNMLAPDPSESVVVVLDADDVGDIDARELCMSTTVLDLAGHRGEASPWICGPCHARFVPDARAGVDEPVWTDADLVPDGYCGAPPSNDSTSSSGGGADESTSTATTTSTTADPTTGGMTTDGSSGEASGSGAADGALDRGCACRSDAGRTPALLLFVVISLRRRGRSGSAPAASR